ncbi:nitrogen fixation protein NifZ [Cohaesibacter sp. ES.047]|uniref:nitrogen fixation protein NifZ n=1 Tax=Cohaesibacter sp. ES.047 TaxID=1798205 RepID=UPI000BB8C82A|nr:nitrogen fixation protein NifZ [Cohaesibacter sp. ES.047]SNY92939.1 nitrogen fixation protein NifZ [Cohaesibacter sp. ES.047]
MIESQPPERFEYGDVVRVTRNVRNDGTYPGAKTGTLLIRRGSTGVVRDIGTFLQDQVIYTIHFTDEDRIVGCRDKELIPVDAPWTPSRFEFSEKVVARIPLGIQGEVVARVGDQGEIIKVIRDDDVVEALGSVAYHVRFPGRTLMVPESALSPDDSDAQGTGGEGVLEA